MIDHQANKQYILEKTLEDPTFICRFEHLTINERMLAEDIARKSSAEDRMTLLEKDPRFIEFIINPTYEEERYVILNMKDWKHYLTNPSEEAKSLAIGAWLQNHKILL